ncbi:MAG: hypothetical protein KDJ67_08650 [Nitratireductor sp.]|nr:hypothetical protein [Nitratireductor sp.]
MTFDSAGESAGEYVCEWIGVFPAKAFCQCRPSVSKLLSDFWEVGFLPRQIAETRLVQDFGGGGTFMEPPPPVFRVDQCRDQSA